MQVIESIDQMQKTSETLRLGGELLALVPTMGYLHGGHLELMKVGKSHADRLMISIFVNPTQFEPEEDLERYPRDTAGDLEKARAVGADIVFMPSPQAMYPYAYQTSVSVSDLTRHLCGLSRPSHFQGVTTVVAKLFHIMKPHIAVFGQKDYQQLTVVTRMVMDLNMDIRIVGVPTVREPDGLAMSSRNGYLNADERKSALSLYQSLELARGMVAGGERNAAVVRAAVEAYIKARPFTKIEYVTLCDPVTLEDVDTVETDTLLALAVRVGRTRLIDNCLIREANHNERQ